MIICRTPLRVSLFGGGSDIPAYFEKNSGAVLSFAINKYIYTTIHPLIESNQILLKYSKNELVEKISDIKHPVFRKILERYSAAGIDISVSSDVAAGTGLGSSSAFTVNILQLIKEYLGISYSKRSLAEEACEIELDQLQEPIGLQDQFASAFGNLNLLEFSKNRNVAVTPLEQVTEIDNLISKNMILIRVGGLRSAGDVLNAQISSMSDMQKQETLLQMAEQARQAYRKIQDGPEWMGNLLHEAWTLKKSLSPIISNKDVDDLYEHLLELGAYGGKLLGAGKSGYFLVIAEEKVVGQIKNQKNLSTLSIARDREGSKIIYKSEDL